MLAAATSFFARTAISQSYNIGHASSNSRPSTPGSGGSSFTAPAASTPTFHVGLWKVQSGSHKVTNKRVSVWIFDKRGVEMERLSVSGKDRAMEVLKAEASALGRLRHPCILEMVEPLEETRSELIFATEPVLSSLGLSIPGSTARSSLVELDEIEIQKGILQISKGLAFLHTSGQLIHSNICPESIIINGSGDWKISGLGLTIPLLGPNGSPTRWEFPTFDGRVPSYVQRSFDYMAPEYGLDEQLLTASDMYSLGCLIYAVHCKGNPPFKTHGSLGGLRENAGKPLMGMERLDPDLQALLRSLVTRHAAGRPSTSSLPSHPFFSSLPISTLNFLDRSNFTAKTREEKVSFMKGLTGVLDRFSEGLRTRKILPSLLEEMKDINLLPYILPNVFAIATALSPTQFANLVLPSLKPLFTIKEPPQNMLTLLDNLSMLQNKTEKNVFREHVLPLVYNALESEHTIVQERALKVVPELCNTIDYAEVQGVLFPRVALVFTKTRVLTVKVATLTTFLAMVKILDQSSLTQKLVPLLSKIRTKEPAVTMATLAVQEAMGFKVDREAVATLVLPQLWAMSIGPMLNVEQFKRFMFVIRKLGERVEKEHEQFLRDSQRLEDRSVPSVNGGGISNNVDFESLIGKANEASVKADSMIDSNQSMDDVWGSIFNGDNLRPSLSPLQHSSTPEQTAASGRTLSPTRVVFSPSPLSSAPTPPSVTTQSLLKPTQVGNTNKWASPQVAATSSPRIQAQISKPNYNISLPTSTPKLQPHYQQGSHPTPSYPNGPAFVSPPIMGELLMPSKLSQPSSGSRSKTLSTNDWDDFDPLS